MLNDPLLLAAMLADRRADLQRAATRSRLTPIDYRRPTWFRRLDVAALRRPRPDPKPLDRDELEGLPDPVLV